MKLVVNNTREEIFIENCKEEYIYGMYISGGWEVYKAQQIDGKWAFVSMMNSYSRWNSSYNSLQRLLKVSTDTIYQFKTSKEFYEWALEVTKNEI